MGRYKTKACIEDSVDESGYVSGYESDGETEYTPADELGKGRFAQARLFKSRDNQEVTVLNSTQIPGDMLEARTKYHFFKTVYPDQQSHLFEFGDDYRLVLPYVTGTPYSYLSNDTESFQVILFRSAIQAFKECHEKGVIILDITSDNIYFDTNTKKSYLIDGGLSTSIGQPLEPSFFQAKREEIEQFKSDFIQFAPECWYIKPNAALATPQMDIYGLAILIQDMFNPLSEKIKPLIERCLDSNPQQRPTLDDLIHALDSSETCDACTVVSSIAI